MAILLVLFFHVAQVSPLDRGRLIEWVGHLQQSGWIGVEMFFTLSGFLITGILLRTVRDPQYLRNFYLRRTLRIFPLYYGVLAVLCVAALVFHLSWHGALPFLLLYVQNFRTDAQGLRLELSSAGVWIPLKHFWSLAVEEQFYLVWPFLVLLVRGRRAFVWIPLLFIVACPSLRMVALGRGVPFGPLRYWTFFHADSLAWGGMGAAAQQFFSSRALRWFQLGSLTLGGMLTLGVLFWEHGYFLEGARPTMQVFFSSFGAFCCGLILMLVEGKSVVSRFFGVSVLRWFGRYSYGIYVFHLLLMGGYERLRYLVIQLTGSRALGALALVGSAYAVSAGLAFVSYHAYEKRFLNLKDRVAGYAVARRISRR